MQKNRSLSASGPMRYLNSVKHVKLGAPSVHPRGSGDFYSYYICFMKYDVIFQQHIIFALHFSTTEISLSSYSIAFHMLASWERPVLSAEVAAEIKLTTSSAATGNFVPGPKMAAAPLAYRKS